MLISQSVCGVIVTYHPGQTMFDDLRNLLAEMQGGVVVDNGSSPTELDAIRAACRDLGFHLIENGKNLGIAEALNQGVRWARGKGYPWLLLLDQDTMASDGYLKAMFETWLTHPQRDAIACIHPRYMRPELGFSPLAPRTRDGSLLWCITSGALMPAWIFDKIGWFASEFFIDWVDIEYCFRIRRAGYQIAQSCEAVLVHDPGDPAPSSMMGFRFWPSHHNPVRRYYMSRNRVVVFRKYFLQLPIPTLKAMYAALRDTAKCFLGERERPRKFRNFLLGTWDGLVGRMGAREGL